MTTYKEYTVKVYNNKTVEWHLNGNLHREDGPAVERANGGKYWYLNGKYHREDGPAIEYPDGYKSWYLSGKKISCKDNDHFLRLIKLKVFW